MTDVVRIVIGLLAWLASFSAVYGLHGISCSFDWADAEIWSLSLMRFALSAAWMAAIALQLGILAGLYSSRLGSKSRFVRAVSRTTAWAGLVAAVWSLFPVVAISSCQ